MDDKAKEAQRAYTKAYRLKNKEAIAARKKAYYEANKDKVHKQISDWKKANPDKVKQYTENYWLKKAKEMEAGPDPGTRCLHCGQPFEAKRSDAKFCGAACRVAYNRNK